MSKLAGLEVNAAKCATINIKGVRLSADLTPQLTTIQETYKYLGISENAQQVDGLMTERVSDETIKRVTTVAKMGASASTIISFVNVWALPTVDWKDMDISSLDGKIRFGSGANSNS
jgi:hypothetical protein